MAAKTKPKHDDAKPDAKSAKGSGTRGEQGFWITVKHGPNAGRPMFLKGVRGHETHAQRLANNQALKSKHGVEPGHPAHEHVEAQRKTSDAAATAREHKVARHTDMHHARVAKKAGVSTHGGTVRDHLDWAKHHHAKAMEAKRIDRAQARRAGDKPADKSAGKSLREQAAEHRAKKPINTPEDRKAEADAHRIDKKANQERSVLHEARQAARRPQVVTKRGDVGPGVTEHEVKFKSTGKSISYLRKESWGKTYYSGDGGTVWHANRTTALQEHKDYTSAKTKSSLRDQAAAHRDSKGGDRQAAASTIRATRSARESSPAVFADRVNRSAATVPKSGRFGDEKVFINHAHAAFEKKHGKIPLDAFKARLLAGHRDRSLELGRADLVESMNRHDVKASTTPFLNAEYHFVRPKENATGKSLREQAASHRASKGGNRQATAATLRAKRHTVPEKAAPAPPFSLRNTTTPARFANTGKGKTKPLFEEMRGAAGRDLPRQKTMFGDRADHHAIGGGIAKTQRHADTLWKRAVETKTSKGMEAAKGQFAKHDDLMVRVRKASESQAKPTTLREQAAAHVAAKAMHGRSDVRAMLESARNNPGARRDRLAANVKAQRAKAATTTTRDPSSHTDHSPGHVGELNTKLIHFDPERFQYKLAAQGEHGVTDALGGVKKWDSNLGGVLQVWKDPANGKVFVVNGHHRLDLANKLGADKVAVRFIEAKSAEHARGIGAMTNIAEGRGTSLDAAKYFRDTGHTKQGLEAAGIPMKERVASEGLALSNLHRPIFDKVVAGDLSPARGAIIGDGLSHAQQTAIMKNLDKMPKGRAPSDAALREAVGHAKAAPTVKTTSRGLFGDDETETSLALHRGEAAAHVRERLSREKKVFGTVAKERNATDLERGGNKIDAAESGKISAAAAENLGTFDLLKHRSGKVSDLLNEAATRVHAGESKKAVHNDVYRRLPAAVQASLSGG